MEGEEVKNVGDINEENVESEENEAVDSVTNEISQINLNDVGSSVNQNSVDVAVPSNINPQSEFSSASIEQSSYWIPPSMRSMGSIVNQLCTDESVPNHEMLWISGSTTIRKLLSLEMQPPITPVLDEQDGIIVERLLYFLTKDHNHHLQFESLWGLTNIASGTSAELDRLLQLEPLELFLKLVLSPSREVSEQAVWLIGNIAGDSTVSRDMILDYGSISILLEALQLHSSPMNKRNVTWALSNCCRGKPPPPLEKLELALPTLCGFLNESDVELVTDACWSLAYISDGDNDRIQAIIDTNSLPTVTKLLRSSVLSILTPSVRIIGNICTGDEFQTDAIINCGVLPQLKYLLDHSKTNIRKEACWAISNITAGNQKQVQLVIEAELIPPLLRALSNDRNIVQNEAAWAISNLTGVGTYDQIRYVVSQDCIPLLIDWLRNQEAPHIATVAIEAFDNILKQDKNGKWSNLFDQDARSLLKSFIEDDDEEEDEDEEDEDDEGEDEVVESNAVTANIIPALPSGASVGTGNDTDINAVNSSLNSNSTSQTKVKSKKAVKNNLKSKTSAHNTLVRTLLARFQQPTPSSLLDICIDHICNNQEYFTSKPNYEYIPSELAEKISSKLSIDKIIKKDKPNTATSTKSGFSF